MREKETEEYSGIVVNNNHVSPEVEEDSHHGIQGSRLARLVKRALRCNGLAALNLFLNYFLLQQGNHPWLSSLWRISLWIPTTLP